MRNKLTASTDSFGDYFTFKGPKKLQKFFCDCAQYPESQDDHIISANDKEGTLKLYNKNDLRYIQT